VEPEVKAVLLDAGGVLLMPDPAAFRVRLAPYGIAPDDEACHRAHILGMAELDRIGRTDYPHADRVIAQWLGVAAGEVEAAADAIKDVYLEDPFVPVHGVAEQLLRLQAAGIRLAIVSNATGKVAAELAKHRICTTADSDCACVDVVIDSAVVGVEKPDPAIFGFALEALQLPPEQCVYLGDSVHFDVNGARAAGIPAVHVAPHTDCAAIDHPHVASVHAFVDQLLGTW
jgi:putative hydrolase of the HAD superfamily